MVNQEQLTAKIQEAKGTFEIIAYLYRHQTACFTDLIRKTCPSQETVRHAIKILLSLDLVSVEEKTSFPKTKIYSLTSKGRLLAEAPVYKWDIILNSFRRPRLRKQESDNYVGGSCRKGL